MEVLPQSVTQLLQSGCPWSDRLCAEVAALGDLNALIFLYEKTDCPWNAEYIMYKSIKYGRLTCLEYVYNKGCRWSILTTDVFPATSCEYDWLACLQFLHQNNCPLNGYTYTAASHCGFLRCLQFLHENKCTTVPANNIMRCAAINGHLDCIMYIHNIMGIPIDSMSCKFAVFKDNLDCTKYMYQNVHENEHFCWIKHICHRFQRHVEPERQKKSFTLAFLYQEILKRIHAKYIMKKEIPKFIRKRREIRRRAAIIIQRVWLEKYYRPCYGAGYQKAYQDFWCLNDEKI